MNKLGALNIDLHTEMLPRIAVVIIFRAISASEINLLCD